MAHHSSITGRAFTLIEAMVVIMIISVLIAILLPVIGSAFDRSRELGSSVNLRTLGQVFEMYVKESKDLYPAPVPDRLYQTPRVGWQTTLPHWQASDQWNLLFEEQYPWNAHTDLYLSPGASRDIEMRPVMTTIFPSYQYSASFLGQPKIWSEEDFPGTEWSSLERSVKQSMVRYPSAKVLLWDVELPTIRRELQWDRYGNLGEPCPMVFADGHTDTRAPADANEGVTNWAPYASHPHQFLHNTRDGVYGRDY